MKHLVNILIYFFVYAAIQVVAGVVVLVAFALVGHGIDGLTDQSLMHDLQMNPGVLLITEIVMAIMAVGAFVAAKWHRLTFEYLKGGNWDIMCFALLIGLGVLLPSAGLEEFLQSVLPESMTRDIAADVFKGLMGTWSGFIIICIFAPIIEEMVFRGAIQREAMKGLVSKLGKGKGQWMAILLSALMFSLIHMNPAQMPHAFLIGILLGWMAHKSGSIVPGIILHWVNNTFSFLLVTFYPKAYDMQMSEFFGNSAWRISLAIFLSLLLLVYAIRQFGTSTGASDEIRTKCCPE